MNDPVTPSSAASASVFRPRWFLVGLLVGTIALALIGRHLGHTDFHPDFVRFSQPISPEGNYYPTIDEMAAIVRARCRADQTLVVVGGNSILLGVWQPVGSVWTKKLQELLGDKFCVVNFAFRGASPSDTGAVLAEVLRKEYPHQIYIADEAALTGVGAIGNDTYRFLFWQAYYAGRLESFPARQLRVKEYFAHPENRYLEPDLIFSNVADSVLHFRTLWNWVGFTHFFTVPSLWAQAMPGEFTPRRDIPDDEPDIYDPLLLPRRYSPTVLDAEMAIIRGGLYHRYETKPDGSVGLSDALVASLNDYAHEAFPPDLVPRTLMLIGMSSPFYLHQLSAEEQAMEAKERAASVALWKANGYHSLSFPPDLTEDDYGDRTHLSTTGGEKLAAVVAPEVQAMAEQLGYTK